MRSVELGEPGFRLKVRGLFPGSSTSPENLNFGNARLLFGALHINLFTASSAILLFLILIPFAFIGRPNRPNRWLSGAHTVL
jgi:hypothetical protein